MFLLQNRPYMYRCLPTSAFFYSICLRRKIGIITRETIQDGGDSQRKWETRYQCRIRSDETEIEGARASRLF